jgi:hypothetical protein
MAGPNNLFFHASVDALQRFFAALERRRRECGIDGSHCQIDPRRRADVVELVLALNLEHG